MSLLLALDATQIVLIVLIGLLIIAYPLLMMRRNKKENQRMTEQTNSLKRGDKVLTTSGVYGKIIDIKLDGTAKQITIETGSDKFKSYMTIDAYAIYQVIKDEVPVAKDITAAENKDAKNAKVEEKAVEAKVEETTQPEVQVAEVKPVEEKPAEKKARAKKAKKAEGAK